MYSGTFKTYFVFILGTAVSIKCQQKIEKIEKKKNDNCHATYTHKWGDTLQRNLLQFYLLSIITVIMSFGTFTTIMLVIYVMKRKQHALHQTQRIPLTFCTARSFLSFDELSYHLYYHFQI